VATRDQLERLVQALVQRSESIKAEDLAQAIREARGAVQEPITKKFEEKLAHLARHSRPRRSLARPDVSVRMPWLSDAGDVPPPAPADGGAAPQPLPAGEHPQQGRDRSRTVLLAPPPMKLPARVPENSERNDAGRACQPIAPRPEPQVSALNAAAMVSMADLFAANDELRGLMPPK